MPLGDKSPGQYTADDEPVHAVSWHRCPARILPAPPPNSSSPAPQESPSADRCVAWAFIDQSSGKLIDMTWQQ